MMEKTYDGEDEVVIYAKMLGGSSYVHMLTADLHIWSCKRVRHTTKTEYCCSYKGRRV